LKHKTPCEAAQGSKEPASLRCAAPERGREDFIPALPAKCKPDQPTDIRGRSPHDEVRTRPSSNHAQYRRPDEGDSPARLCSNIKPPDEVGQRPISTQAPQARRNSTRNRSQQDPDRHLTTPTRNQANPARGSRGRSPQAWGPGLGPGSNITALGEVARRADKQPYPARGSRGRSPLAWGPGLGPGAISRPSAKSPEGGRAAIPGSGVQGAKPPGVGSGARPRSNITAPGEVPEGDEHRRPARSAATTRTWTRRTKISCAADYTTADRENSRSLPSADRPASNCLAAPPSPGRARWCCSPRRSAGRPGCVVGAAAGRRRPFFCSLNFLGCFRGCSFHAPGGK